MAVQRLLTVKDSDRGRGKHMAFAEGTTVSVEKSRAEIEKLITRYGATSIAFMTAPGRAIVCFEANGRRIMFELKLPDRTEKRFLRDGRGSLMPRSDTCTRLR